MKLRHVRIQNFRGIQDLSLDLDDTTVLIGENNSGKTAVLHALRLCLYDLGPRKRLIFDPFDLHLKDATADPAAADPLTITITFRDDPTAPWDNALIQLLQQAKILQVSADGQTNQVTLEVTCAYDAASKDYKQEWTFLNTAGQALPNVQDTALGALQREVSYYYLAALRDAARHFDANGPFWKPFLRDSQLTDDKKAEIEKKLKEVNDLVVTSHTSFAQVRDSLKTLQDLVPTAAGDIVSIEAVPGRMFDILSRSQVNLGTVTGAKIPVGRHGEGTQSLAVLKLFSAFLDTKQGGNPIVALEEPEAHLHPAAVRTLWSTLEGLQGQKLISTHSGDLLSEIKVEMVRRLARTPTGVHTFRVTPGSLTDEESRKFNYHIRRSRGELLFARCWLLVEGETEGWVYPAAARASGIDLHKAGVRIVEYSQTDVGTLAKIANLLGISWFCVADNDQAWPDKYEPPVRANLNGRADADAFALPYVNAEVHLLASGYDAIYAAFMPAQNLARVTRSPGQPGYWEEYASHLPNKAKTRGAALVAEEMERRGPAGVTPEILQVLTKVVAVAGVP